MHTCYDTHVKVVGQAQATVSAFNLVFLSCVNQTNRMVSFQHLSCLCSPVPGRVMLGLQMGALLHLGFT